MSPLDLAGLTLLMERTSGRRTLMVGLVDGPVDMGNAKLNTEAVQEAAVRPSARVSGCSLPRSISCRHGTFVAGILAARRGSRAPAICPECTLLVRAIFAEATQQLPSTTPDELASAIVEVVEAGAKVVNLSCQLLPESRGADSALAGALDFVASRGAICVAAAGNDGFVGGSAMIRHPWVIPVAACDGAGRPAAGTNLGHSIGRRGLLAPGERIHSLGPGNEEIFLDGTSAAAPFVTGTAALLWSEFPEAEASDIWQAITQSGVARRNSVVPPLLDAWRAYQWLNLHFGRAAA